MERDFATWKELTIDFRGRTVSGSYSTSREGLVSVKTLRGNKTTTLGGSNGLMRTKHLVLYRIAGNYTGHAIENAIFLRFICIHISSPSIPN